MPTQQLESSAFKRTCSIDPKNPAAATTAAATGKLKINVSMAF